MYLFTLAAAMAAGPALASSSNKAAAPVPVSVVAPLPARPLALDYVRFEGAPTPIAAAPLSVAEQLHAAGNAIPQALQPQAAGEQSAAAASQAFDAPKRNEHGEVVVAKCPFHRLLGLDASGKNPKARSPIVPGAVAPKHPTVLKFSPWAITKRAFRYFADKLMGRDAFQGHPRPTRAPMAGLAALAARHLNNPVAGLTALHEAYGDVSYAETFFGQRAFFIADPKAIDQILQDTDRGPDSPFEKSELGIGGIAKLTGRGTVFLGSGARWKSRRTVMQPYFQSSMMKQEAIHDHMEGLIGLGLDNLALRAATAGPGFETRVSDEMSELTMKVILGVLFDYDAPSTHLRYLIGPAFAEVVKTVPAESISPLTARLSKVPFYPRRKKLANAYKTLDLFAEAILKHGRKRTQAQGDMLDALLGAVDETGKPLSDEELKNEILTMILAGHETTSATATWALYSLARSPEKLKTLRAELAEARASGATAHEALRDGKLPYLGQVIQETLRLYTPAYALFRRANRDVVIETANGPLYIPEGSHIVLSTFVTHRRDEQWGPERTGFEAGEFHPERFDRFNIAQRRLKRGDLQTFAFGNGPRVCLGQSLSVLEAQLIVLRFLERFDAEPVSVLPAKIVSDIGVKLADGFTARVTLRGAKP